MEPSDSHNDEKRRHKRAQASFIVTYQLRTPIVIELRTPQLNFTAVAVDISEGGIGVVINESISPNTKVRISFSLYNEHPGPDLEMRRWFEFHGKVQYCYHSPKAGHHAGIQFEHVPDEDRLFIEEFVRSQNLRKAKGGREL